MKFIKYVVIWYNTREYGGPEEGGWWFDTGEPYKVYTCYHPDEVTHYQQSAQEQVDKMNEGRRPLSSVLATGRYSVTVEERKPRGYPAVQPHFE